jgi:hypothetical protein
MTKMTRYFLFGSVAFVVLGLTVGLVGYYGGLPGLAFARTVGPVELQYIPADATVVAFANVQDVMQSSFRQKMKQLDPSGDKGQQELRDALGIDLETDIHQVVACMLSGGGSPEKNGLIIGTGSFNQAKIEGFIREKGGVSAPYGGKTLFTHQGLTSEHQNLARQPGKPALAFLQPNVVAFGSEAAVRRAIEIGSRPDASVRANTEMMDQIAKLDDGNVWAVGRFDAIAHTAKLPEQVAIQIPAISWFAASGRVNGGVSGTVSVLARDDEAAANLRQVASGFMALARMQTGSKPEIDSMLKMIQLGGDGRTVSVSFSVPSEMLDLLTAAHAGKIKTSVPK